MQPASIASAFVPLFLLAGCANHLQANPPHIFFSDLEGGPKTGGEANRGAFVTIYGSGFGNAQATSVVTVGNGAVAAYRVWTDGRIVFQLGPLANTGDIVVHSDQGDSNHIPFGIRAGNIFFVANGGNDGHSGEQSSPWKSIPHAVQTIEPGDIIYAMDRVTQDGDDGQGWDAALTLRSEWCGKTGYPRALVAYPGATVTIGPSSAMRPASGLRTVDFSADGGACQGNWVFSGLRFRGVNPVAVNGPSDRWRFVGNDISCPQAKGDDGGGACFETTLASNVQLWGNSVHDAGAADASALFQGVYFSTDSNHVDMGWNTVANIHGCRGVQIHSSPLGSGYPDSGYNQYDIAIHDNLIHDTQCDGIIVDTVDPSRGAIRIYNNVIYFAGKGPGNPENTGGWACIYAPATTESGPRGGGVIEIFNNTLYSCGTFEKPPYGSSNAAIVGGEKVVRIENNIIYQTKTKLFPGGVPYLVIWDSTVANGGRVCEDTENCPGIQGTNNLMFGSNQYLQNTWVTGTIYSDPLIKGIQALDFHPGPGSPVQSAGVSVPVLWDKDGQPRLPSAGTDLGAYQVEPRATMPVHPREKRSQATGQ